MMGQAPHQPLPAVVTTHPDPVLIFSLARSSAALVRTWWPDLTAVIGRDLWLDDTPNITPTYIQAQLGAYAPVGLVVVDGWEMLLLDGDELPTRRDPRLLRALNRLARQWAVPIIAHSLFSSAPVNGCPRYPTVNAPPVELWPWVTAISPRSARANEASF